MAVRARDVIDEIVSLLDSNITDPNPERRSEGRDWITARSVAVGLPEYPAIRVQKVSSQHSLLTIGKTTVLVQQRIQVSILYEKAAELDVDQDDKEEDNSENALDYLAAEVVDTVNGNQTSFQNLDADVQSVLTVADERAPSGDSNVLRHNVDVMARFQR